MTKSNLTRYIATASYRMPREHGSNEPSRVLWLVWNGTFARMSGGKWGAHEVSATDNARVTAHWRGYVSNNMGREVKAAIKFTKVN